MNPNLRFLVVSSSSKPARDIVDEVIDIFENPTVKKLFGNLQGKKWGREGLTLNLKTKTTREPNVMPAGLGTNITGMHFEYIIADDIVVEEDRTSIAKREMTKLRYNGLRYHLDKQHGDFGFHIVGTRWHSEELYHFMINEYDVKHIEIEGVYEKDENGEYIQDKLRFSHITKEDIDDLKKEDPILFSCVMLNEPIAGDNLAFPRASLHLFDRNKIDYSMFTKIAHVDLSMGKVHSNYQCIVTIGVEEYIIKTIKKYRYYVIDVFLDKIPQTDLINLIFEKHDYYNYFYFSIDTVSMQETFKNWIDERKNTEIEKIDELIKNTSNVSKIDYYSTKKKKLVNLYFDEYVTSKNKIAEIRSISGIISDGHILFDKDYEQNIHYKRAINQLVNWHSLARYDDFPDALQVCFKNSELYGQISSIELGF